ncbi:ankyrin repeat domain-containing protein [Congregicoccus parvus]|uniref:ankyrin repeat domain-containing protein n=1 Tax=Congregicoccus parvus TaxID=3081749 RepID=UPI003FA587CB
MTSRIGIVPRMLGVVFSLAFAADPILAEDARKTTLRQILFVAGPASHAPGEHEFPAGVELLAKALDAAGAGVRANAVVGWPDAATLERADAIVIYSDGLGDHVAAHAVSSLREYTRRGGGVAVLHFALEPEPGPLADWMLEHVGGRFEVDRSVNPIWTVREPTLADHPVTRGVKSFTMEDEWYFHLRFSERAVPVLTAVPPSDAVGADGPRTGNASVRAAVEGREPQTLAWVREEGAARAFGFTGGHFHRNWADENVRRLVLNAAVWITGLDVPAQGVESVVSPIPRYTTIDEAIARDDLEDVQRHVGADRGRIERGRHATLRPLHQAILRNREAIAVFLVEAGADVDVDDGSARTPLHLAVERGSVVLVGALVAAGADADRKDARGWTPLHHAAARDRVDIARALLDGGADVRVRSELGGTALHEAAASGGEAVIRLLLERGVDASVVSSTGVTALDIAREYGNEIAIGLLTPVP